MTQPLAPATDLATVPAHPYLLAQARPARGGGAGFWSILSGIAAPPAAPASPTRLSLRAAVSAGVDPLAVTAPGGGVGQAGSARAQSLRSRAQVWREGGGSDHDALGAETPAGGSVEGTGQGAADAGAEARER